MLPSGTHTSKRVIHGNEVRDQSNGNIRLYKLVVLDVTIWNSTYFKWNRFFIIGAQLP